MLISVVGWPDILPSEDTLPTDILSNGHFAEWTFSRTDILPNGLFAEKTLCQTDNLPKTEIFSEL
jgi:hypothetical protein